MGGVAETAPRRLAVLLTELQQRIASVVQRLPEAEGFAMAGAGALMVRGLIDRPTQDLDYFTVPGEESSIGSLRDALEKSLRRAGLTCTRQRDLPTFVRLEVSDGTDSCQIDLAVDYRNLPIESSIFGPTLATKELAAGKVLALFDRAEARDFLDLDALVHHFDLDELLELAGEKDRGFNRRRFLEALSRFQRLSAEELGLTNRQRHRLGLRVDNWSRHLQQDLDPPERGMGLDR